MSNWFVCILHSIKSYKTFTDGHQIQCHLELITKQRSYLQRVHAHFLLVCSFLRKSGTVFICETKSVPVWSILHTLSTIILNIEQRYGLHNVQTGLRKTFTISPTCTWIIQNSIFITFKYKTFWICILPIEHLITFCLYLNHKLQYQGIIYIF